MEINLPIIAGMISTTLFALSTLPMLLKAYRTKDLKSYSLGYLLLGNAGNIFHSVYVYDMPPGPIWLLHTFYLIATGLMLFWYLRYEWWPSMKGRLRDRITKSERNSRSALRHPMPARKGRYPVDIPHLGHDLVLPLPYTEHEGSRLQIFEKGRHVTSEQNKALERRLIKQVWNQRNFAIANELIASDYVGHSSTPADETHGHEGYRQFYTVPR